MTDLAKVPCACQEPRPELDIHTESQLYYACGRPISPEAFSAWSVNEHHELWCYSPGRPFDFMNPLIG